MIGPWEFLVIVVSLLPWIALVAVAVYLVLSVRSLHRRLRVLEDRLATAAEAPPKG